MTDAKTQRLMDELVTLRRENLALRLEVTQLRDCLRQRDGAPQGGMGTAPVLRAANGRLGGAAGEFGVRQTCRHCGEPRVVLDHICPVRIREIMRTGYADFDRSIAKEGSEEDGSV